MYGLFTMYQPPTTAQQRGEEAHAATPGRAMESRGGFAGAGRAS